MKNQYFGDVNDYRKYGLLRLLKRRGARSVAICWMLTEDDGKTDGRFTEYLADPIKWRHYDPELYDALRHSVLKKKIRNVLEAESAQLIPHAWYYPRILKDSQADRLEYFRAFFQWSKPSDMVFFDPDNGIEVKSIPIGRKSSSKYIYWDEIVQAFSLGHSIVIYQHFGRVDRGFFIRTLIDEIARKTGARELFSFMTSNVVFLLLPHRNEVLSFEKCAQLVGRTWQGQILPTFHNLTTGKEHNYSTALRLFS